MNNYFELKRKNTSRNFLHKQKLVLVFCRNFAQFYYQWKNQYFDFKKWLKKGTEINVPFTFSSRKK